MSTIVSWLKPTKIKLLFLVEWSAFIVIEMTRGKLDSELSILVAGYPLILFYLAACALAALSQHTRRIACGLRLVALAIGLVLLDQIPKTLVTTLLPVQASVPVVENWLHVAHTRNYAGSWIAAAFNVPGAAAIKIVQGCIIVAVLALACRVHRNYVTQQRQSLWADVAFLGIVAACARKFRLSLE